MPAGGSSHQNNVVKMQFTLCQRMIALKVSQFLTNKSLAFCELVIEKIKQALRAFFPYILVPLKKAGFGSSIFHFFWTERFQ